MEAPTVPDRVLALLRAGREADQPAAFFRAFGAVLRTVPGYRFMTCFVVHGQQTVRVFSTDEPNYPVNAAKPMRATAWWDQVVDRGECFLAADHAAVEAAFPDHALIRSLGCGAVASAPVIFGGRCLGVVNANDREHRYGAADLRALDALAQAAAPAFLDILHRFDRGR